MSLIKTMIGDPYFKCCLGSVKPEELLPIGTVGINHSWSYGRGPFWTDEVDVGTALEFANIHRLLWEDVTKWANHPVLVVGDELGLTESVCKFEKLRYYDEGNEEVRKLNREIRQIGFEKHYCSIKDGTVVVSFLDNIELLYDLDSEEGFVPYKAFLLTGNVNNITLFAMEYTIINLGIVLEKSYYWNLEKVTTSGNYTLLHLNAIVEK